MEDGRKVVEVRNVEGGRKLGGESEKGGRWKLGR